MQTSLHTKPLHCNELDTPGWYQFAAGHENQVPVEAEEESDLPIDESPFEQEESEDDNPDDEPPEPHPPESTHDRQSAIMFHLREAPVHAMLFWSDFGTMMAEIALHFSVGREELLECHEVNVHPPDIPHGTSPLIIQMVQDIPVGHAAVLILVDLEIHGQHMEPNYQVGPRIDPLVLPVPQQLSRHALLMRANVFEYCRLEHFRCLVECNKVSWPLQVTWPRTMEHGDYVVIKIPPPRLNTACAVETLDAAGTWKSMIFGPISMCHLARHKRARMKMYPLAWLIPRIFGLNLGIDILRMIIILSCSFNWGVQSHPLLRLH